MATVEHLKHPAVARVLRRLYMTDVITTTAQTDAGRGRWLRTLRNKLAVAPQAAPSREGVSAWRLRRSPLAIMAQAAAVRAALTGEADPWRCSDPAAWSHLAKALAGAVSRQGWHVWAACHELPDAIAAPLSPSPRPRIRRQRWETYPAVRPASVTEARKCRTGRGWRTECHACVTNHVVLLWRIADPQTLAIRAIGTQHALSTDRTLPDGWTWGIDDLGLCVAHNGRTWHPIRATS
jgi:hypothetical protein